MVLKYKQIDRVVIGSHTEHENKFQITNHYNMVEDCLSKALKELDEFRRANNLVNDSSIERIKHYLGNAQAQHFNEGVCIKSIKELDIITRN